MKSSLFLCEKYPHLGVSPDAIDEKYVVEIKCSTSEKSVRTCIDSNNNDTVLIKYVIQMQIQMLFTERKKVLFIVADPKFEETNRFGHIVINYVSQYINKLPEDWNRF